MIDVIMSREKKKSTDKKLEISYIKILSMNIVDHQGLFLLQKQALVNFTSAFTVLFFFPHKLPRFIRAFLCIIKSENNDYFSARTELHSDMLDSGP